MSRKKVLIIGASSSIGCELIRQLAKEDIVILAHYNSCLSGLEVIAKEANAEIVPIQADLSSQEGVMGLLDSIKQSYGTPQQIVFLAAPVLKLIRFKDLEWTDFKQQNEMQMFTAYEILREFLPLMAKEKYGRVVFMLTSYTFGVPPAAMAHYVTAKYALLGLMKALSSEYAPKRICINAVSPSMIETDYLSAIPEKIVEITADQHPRKSIGIPRDVAPVIKFLLSDEAGYITGINLPVTGGA